MNNISFLCTYYAQPDLLDICLYSIRQHCPYSNIIVSRQINEDFSVSEDILDKYDVSKRITHDMRQTNWSSVAQDMARECETDFAVYIEHDAFLLNNLDEILNPMFNGDYDLAGPEEVIPFEGLNRNAPGFVTQNFFILNMKKMKEAGLEKMRINYMDPSAAGIKNQESGYGISQTLEKKLLLTSIKSGYAHGTYYMLGNTPIAHHLWYGSYRKRNVFNDGINPMWMDHEANRLVEDYWSGKIQWPNSQ